LSELVDDYAAGDLSKSQFMAAKRTAEAKLKDTEGQLSRLTYRQTLTGIDLTQKLPDKWATASLDWKRSIIELLIDKIVINKRERHFKRVYYEDWWAGRRYRDLLRTRSVEEQGRRQLPGGQHWSHQGRGRSKGPRHGSRAWRRAHHPEAGWHYRGAQHLSA
jgi:hypothetical protein